MIAQVTRTSAQQWIISVVSEVNSVMESGKKKKKKKPAKSNTDAWKNGQPLE